MTITTYGTKATREGYGDGLMALGEKDPRVVVVGMDLTEAQWLAVRSRLHTPVGFDDPEKFVRTGFHEEKPILAKSGDGTDDVNSSRRYLLEVARSARDAS